MITTMMAMISKAPPIQIATTNNVGNESSETAK